METVRCSIREMVEFISRSGHIITEISANNRAVEGTRIHQLIQKQQGASYHAEVALNYEFEYEGFLYVLQGRMDGLIILEDEVCIDEIKSVTYPLDDLDLDHVNQRHFHQLMCYAYIYCVQNDLKEIDCQLTYYDVNNKDQKILKEHFLFEQIESIFFSIVEQYHAFVKLYFDFKEIRDQSLETLAFPYDHYRNGQQEMMNAVYYTIKNKQKLFIHAATGLGKTLGTVFPALRALHHGHTNKIMYLTAKAITRTVAKETLSHLEKCGLILRTVIITAKDQMCFLEERHCHPDYCPYAKNHYDRVNQAMLDIMAHANTYDKENIQAFALKHEVCPFEFSLDLFLFSDFSILDYNYAFDPRVNLQRAFYPESKLTMLVDEAHNLVDRSRDMYSKALFHSHIRQVKTLMSDRSKNAYKALIALDEAMLQLKNDLVDRPYIVDYQPPAEIAKLVENNLWAMQKYLSENGEQEQEILDLYFECVAFMKIYELYRESYVTYAIDDGDVMLKIYCMDPSSLLNDYYSQAQAVIFFSATLLPIQYFYRILGGKKDDFKLYYDSPFDSQNRLVLVGNDVQAKYRQRIYSYDKICRYIAELAKGKTGNYLIFFSSYEYLNQVYQRFVPNDEVYVYKQEGQMSLEDKNIFLDHFKTVKDRSQVFFTVLGGMFSEGIDFKGEQLIGTIIVGVGLPQLGLERDLIKSYFEKDGYDYAYKYPGMNKVLQAAGRVIRTNQDRGVILLLDERYASKEYTKMFPREWKHLQKTSVDHISKQLETFWNSENKQ